MNRAVRPGKGMDPDWALQGNALTFVTLLLSCAPKRPVLHIKVVITIIVLLISAPSPSILMAEVLSHRKYFMSFHSFV